MIKYRDDATKELFELVSKRNNDYASERNKVRELIEDHRADVNAVNENNLTPLRLAACHNLPGIARILIEYGADVNKLPASRLGPLHNVAEYGHTEMCQILLEHGARVNEPSDDRNNIALHYAAARGHDETCKVLLQHSADIDNRNDEGTTPLLWAVENGHFGVMRVLLEAGANPTIPDSRFGTRYHKATDCRLVTDYLEELKKSGWTPPVRTVAAPSADVIADESPHVQQLKKARAKLRGFERPESDDIGRTGRR